MPKRKLSATSTRRRHTNSKLGCSNCKRKKIRCDEGLPECGNCSRGKRDRCSYLSLSSAESNRIKLTHSLRKSQNKLLNQDYRLPASTWTKIPASQAPVEKPDAILEFRFELQKLPLPIPSTRYPSIEFSNSFIFDFNDRFQTTDIDDSPILDENKLHMLPHGMLSPSEFKPLNYAKIAGKRLKETSQPTVIHPDCRHHEFQGSVSLLDHFHDFLYETSVKYLSPNHETLLEAFASLGFGVIVNQLYHKIKSHRFRELMTYLDGLTKRCLDQLITSVEKLRSLSEEFNRDLKDEDMPLLSFKACIVGYTSYFLTRTSIALRFSIERYRRSRKGVFPAIETYCQIAALKGYETRPEFEFVRNNIQFNIKSILIPSYYPQFLFEVYDNLKSLEYVYHAKLSIQNSELSMIQSRLQYQYHSLLEMFHTELLPVLYLTRNEDSVTVYTCTVMFEIAKLWISIFPTEAIVYYPKIDDRYPQESQFLEDLAKTLYMYFYAVSVSLDAVFPACKHLFSVSFMPPTSRFFYDRKTMTTSVDNEYHKVLNSQALLQRHNYYSMRLYAFFRRRYSFYLIYLKVSDNNTYTLENRLKPRRIFNLLESTIKSFNTTLIRPEHYPTRNEAIVVEDPDIPVITRTDEAMTKKMYTRNIETLNFFKSSILQFDHETMLLLRDYRPPDDGSTITLTKVPLESVEKYSEDRSILLDQLI